jgi:hypothetical protein
MKEEPKARHRPYQGTFQRRYVEARAMVDELFPDSNAFSKRYVLQFFDDLRAMFAEFPLDEQKCQILLKCDEEPYRVKENTHWGKLIKVVKWWARWRLDDD